MTLDVDASDAPMKILHATMTMPATPGPMSLFYPKWIPGEHMPSGPISNLTELHILADGKELDWRRDLVETLRTAVLAAGPLEEVIKWGHLVYLSNGPVLLIRAEEQRVLFGFWRGQRLTAIEPRLKRGGKYEMATLELLEGMTITPARVRRLTREAVVLNKTLGNPTDVGPRKR